MYFVDFNEDFHNIIHQHLWCTMIKKMAYPPHWVSAITAMAITRLNRTQKTSCIYTEMIIVLVLVGRNVICRALSYQHISIEGNAISSLRLAYDIILVRGCMKSFQQKTLEYRLTWRVARNMILSCKSVWSCYYICYCFTGKSETIFNRLHLLKALLVHYMSNKVQQSKSTDEKVEPLKRRVTGKQLQLPWLLKEQMTNYLRE